MSFTDDADNDEALTSAETAVVSATAPGSPGSVDVQPSGTGTLEVTWQAPASSGGSSITGYTIQWKLASGSWDTPVDVSEATATGTTHTITNLELDVEYSVRVIATNSVGDGPASAESTATPVAESSEQQLATQNSPASGQSAVSGDMWVGETLTVDTSSVADADGLDQRQLQLPMDFQRRDGRRGHPGRHRCLLHFGSCRPGQGHQGEGELHRRCGQR